MSGLARVLTFLNTAADDAAAVNEVRFAAKKAKQVVEKLSAEGVSAAEWESQQHVIRILNKRLKAAEDQLDSARQEAERLSEEIKAMRETKREVESRPFAATELYVLNAMSGHGYTRWFQFSEVSSAGSPAAVHKALARLEEIGAIDVSRDVQPRRYKVNHSMSDELRNRINSAGHVTLYQEDGDNILDEPPTG